MQIAEEFKDREQLLIAKNVELKQERDQAQINYRKATTIVAQMKQDEVNLKKVIVELCLELLDMQLEPKASILDNVQKVVVHTQALAIIMDMVETEYKAKIAELEQRDPSALARQLKEEPEEISGKIEQSIQETAQLLEATTSSQMGIEQINTIEEVRIDIRQVDADIARLKEEMEGLTQVHRMIKSGESKKLQIPQQKLWEEETEFLQVTLPWQDKLADLTLQMEAKIAEFQETQTTVVNLFAGKVIKESLEQARGSVAKMDGAHTKLNGVYTQWYDKMHQIIEECKEQK